AGEWNSYDILCKDNTIQLTVNGILQNTATESTLVAGAICLQSEGSPIEFRNIKLTPLK
ncbi:MAG: 3-keto-disaccharide hydrolase, partial [Planctomycetota bacterium]